MSTSNIQFDSNNNDPVLFVTGFPASLYRGYGYEDLYAETPEARKNLVSNVVCDVIAARRDHLALVEREEPAVAAVGKPYAERGAADVIPPYRGKYKSRMQEWSYIRTGNATSPAPSTAVDIKLSEIEGMDKLAGLKKAAMRKRLETAFANLKAKVAGAEHEFYTTAYKFVLGKVSNRMYEAGECAKDQHDIANNVLLEFSRSSFDEVGDICKYLAKAAYKQGGTAFSENIEYRETHESLTVELEDGDSDGNGEGEAYQQDNPAVHGDIRYKRGGIPVFQESRPQFRRELPAFIQGKYLRICQLIREDYPYEKIAREMGMTVPAVKLSVARMKKEITQMKAQGLL